MVVFLKLIIERLQRSGDIIDHDMRLLLHACRDLVDADSGPERIGIAKLMPHNQYLILSDHKFTQCLGLDSRLDPRILGCLLPLASVILDAVLVFDDRPITSPCKRKVDRHTGIIIALSVRLLAESKPDT